MEQLEELSQQGALEVRTTQKDFGITTEAINPRGISDNNTAISSGENTAIYSFKSYQEGTYDVIYLEINDSGEVVNRYKESEGVLPTLFHAPDGTVWMTLTSNKMDGIKEIVLPLIDRSRVKKLKTSREFPGDVIGIHNDQVMLHNTDPFDQSTPDKLCRLTFDKNHLYKGRKAVKLEKPGRNKAYIAPNGELHLLKYDYEKRALIHRLINDENTVEKERAIVIEAIHYGIINLSFDSDSVMVVAGEHDMNLVRVTPDGEVSKIELFVDSRGEYFYNFWGPTSLGNNHYLIKYNHDGGNGWAVFNLDGLVEHFIDQDELYVNPNTGEKIDLELDNAILGEAVGYSSGKYSLALYNSSTSEIRNNGSKFVVLTRSL